MGSDDCTEVTIMCVLHYRFLYQVFPGSPKQCERLLRQAAKTGDLRTVEKLVHNNYMNFFTSFPGI